MGRCEYRKGYKEVERRRPEKRVGEKGDERNLRGRGELEERSVEDMRKEET